MLLENTILQELYLAHNEIKSEGGILILEGLLGNTYIRVFDISYNRLMQISFVRLQKKREWEFK